jgi:hypothetical protein
MLNYQKVSAEEDKLRNLLPDGEYIAHIEDLVLTKSKGGLDKDGNPKPILQMIQLDLVVTDMNGRSRKMKDWVVLEGDMSWKFRHLAASCGKLDKYEDGTLGMHDISGAQVTVKIVSKDGKDQNNNPVTRNNIADYLSKNESVPLKKEEEFLNDDLPF